MSAPLGQNNDPLASLNAHIQNQIKAEDTGEGNWLVSYADMMTLLVGFFIILLSFSTMDNEKFEILKRAASKEFGGSYQVPYGKVADRIRESINKQGLGDQFSIKQSDLGIEISLRGTVFFDMGSTDMKPAGKELLNKIIPIISTESPDCDILIEGHTDDIPTGSNFELKSNWELSSVRACRVLDEFQSMGFSKSRLTAVGYGEARPIVPNRDSAGNPIPQNMSQNRRVVIKVLKRSLPSIGVVESEATAPTPHPLISVGP